MANTNTITIGKIGFNTVIYSPTATYNKNDVVLYNNSLYICIQDNSSASAINDDTKYVLVIKGITPKGAYDSSATYGVNDIVIYNDSAYICKTDGVTELPTDTTKWMQLATPSLNCGFGINNRYALSAPDSDLVALWNLFHNGSMDGEQTLYGMTLVDNDKPVPVLANPAPYHDSLIKYQLSTQPNNTGKCNDSGIHVNIPSFVMDTVGDERTFRFLVYFSKSDTNAYYIRFASPSRLSADFPDTNSYALQFGVGGYYYWITLLTAGGGYDIVNSSSISGSNWYSLIRPNNINEFVFTLKRVSNGYEYQVFFNGIKATSGTSTRNYNATISDIYLGTCANNNYENTWDRGLIQLEVYNGIKYTADYTPEFKLLSEPVTP